MDIRYLFKRDGVTVAGVAAAAEVDHSTAWRWKNGPSRPEWSQIVKLYGRGLITDDDLRAAGLAIPRAAPAPVSQPDIAPPAEDKPTDPPAEAVGEDAPTTESMANGFVDLVVKRGLAVGGRHS